MFVRDVKLFKEGSYQGEGSGVGRTVRAGEVTFLDGPTWIVDAIQNRCQIFRTFRQFSMIFLRHEVIFFVFCFIR
jgi:hypothetical protein